MINRFDISLFNMNKQPDYLLENIQKQLNQDSHILVTKMDIQEILEDRNNILIEKGMIDFSVDYLIKGAELLLTHTTSQTRLWKIDIALYFDIFYEIRKNVPSLVEDEMIFQKIEKQFSFFDGDLNHVAGYFETNLDWYKEELNDIFNEK
ncbi:hypothetical protein [Vagococcus sp.]|uniref:hypothetical protein n=1 Tax=Vagococcus sp. TaxID=1933889 RepID=UPI002FC6AA16